MLTVKMLGGLKVSLNGHRVRIDLGVSGRLLAAYLFQFCERVHRRDRLARLFWADLDGEHSRAALNTALWRLRKLLALEQASNDGANLYSSGQEIVLESAPWLSVDTHQFDLAARNALRTGEVSKECLAAQYFEDAADAYSGAFLDGEDMEWIIVEREKLHSTYVRCLTELVRRYAILEQYELAISAARRILAVDPFRESMQRRLIVLLTLNGQRVQAIVELRRWKAALRDEIGIDPMPETCALERAIASRDLSKEILSLKRKYFEATAAA